MKHTYSIYTTITLGALGIAAGIYLSFFSARPEFVQASSTQTAVVSEEPTSISVGIFVTSIYNIDFQAERFTVTFWLWSTFPTEKMREIAGENYSPFNTIEIVNAQNKIISPTDQYIIPNADGTTYAIAKYTSTIIQHWDVRNFPFDRQNLTIKLESVGLPSSVLNFVPDKQNSLVSEELKISGWNIGELEMEVVNYKYQSTFGDPSQQLGIYPRVVVHIPIKRIGFRLFINSFLGFFISFVIVSLMYLLDVNHRVGLIMTSLFAAVGNKYTIDNYFPNQPAFSLSDLVQICSFAVIAIGLVTTVVSTNYVKHEHQDRARKVDRITFVVIVVGYIAIIGVGTYLAVR